MTGHRLCGTLVEDTIDASIDKKAVAMVIQGCCLFKAEDETPHYGLTKKDWNILCSAANPFKRLSPSSYNYAVNAVTNFRASSLTKNGFSVTVAINDPPIIYASKRKGVFASLLDSLNPNK